MPKQNLALTFILLTVGLDAIGIGLIFPVIPDLMVAVSHDTLANAALWGGLITSAFAVMQFLCGPIIGNLSDHYGRRPVLLTSLAFMVVDYIVMAIAGTVWLLLITRIVAGNPFHRLGLYRRYLDPGSARQTVWPCRCRLWHRLCRGAPDRRGLGHH